MHKKINHRRFELTYYFTNFGVLTCVKENFLKKKINRML